ncbi:AcrR family transcriptional regulator [Streptomyces sp. B4I13]|uniref:TetR/AcrR family transcriptional regulator n=1 Tax=Streptomyces sp. B4I13 TaxID=3042271 RepID=UPI00278B94C3|nr:TetR/AcrR family transcriptional regulator [Streptomyces sp. B4I13]MDQ0956453.1 AcrR family transcriptional regulator [Streptomyces sp. B4I13]
MADDRTEHILDAALTAFCQYGYGKTTMQDVARAAGMSRAALYLHFASKEDLFRAGSRRAHSRALGEVDTALTQQGDVLSRIDAAVTAYFGGLLTQISSSVHGGEVLDASLDVAGDIVSEAHAALVARLASALHTAAAAGEVQFSTSDATAEDIVLLLLAVADGLKKTSADPQLREQRKALFLRLVTAGIAPMRQPPTESNAP